MVQEIINRMPEATGGAMPDANPLSHILRDPPFIQFAQVSAVREAESAESADVCGLVDVSGLADKVVDAPIASGSNRTPDARTSPPDIIHLDAEAGERTLDDMETTCIDYSPQQNQSLDIK